MRITLFGGSGFIGRSLAAELVRRGHSLSLLVRDRERAKGPLILLPNTDVYGYNPNEISSVKKGFAGSDVVINLVGILNESSSHLFERVHSEFVRKVISSCIKNNVGRVIQISALGVSPGAPSAYLRSKAKGEQIVHSCDALQHTIIRPSVVFGREDKFINRFAAMARLPLLPLPLAEAQFQPIYIGDLVTMIANVLEDEIYNNEVLYAGGPEVLSLQEIVQRTAAALHQSPRIFPLGQQSSYLLAALLEKIPFVDALTRDNCLSARFPSVCPKGSNDAEKIVGTLTTLESGLAFMFSHNNAYKQFRHIAGRS
ncbi:MAG: complex I NDUFA9 subunit family protein [Proteobacteria bacterium]|nr:complex I NDUFA9 subunit family protein [Pseudomonadota bacterium]MCH9757845.1 complex I NDUFA9 subunit family protein [Pseudomonadota bacterium]